MVVQIANPVRIPDDRGHCYIPDAAVVYTARFKNDSEDSMAPHNDRFVRAETNGGWGFATFVILLAVACAAVVAA